MTTKTLEKPTVGYTEFEPAEGYLLVRPIDAEEEVTPTGILIPGTADVKRLPQGEVLAIHDGDGPPFLKHDVIVYKGWNAIRLGNRILHIVNKSDVFGILR